MIKFNSNLNKQQLGSKLKNFFVSRSVTVIFIVICAICFQLSNVSLSFYLRDMISRLSRNLFLILALIIPVMAGMGLNFAIVLGAMAGQIAIILVTHFGVVGFPGFLLCLLISFPFALLFGYLIGNLLNKTKGQEMITSLIVGFFSNGIYQFVILIMVGSVIPFSNPQLLLSRGYGIKNTVDLQGGLKYSLDGLLKIPFPKVLFYSGLLIIAIIAILVLIQKKYKNRFGQLISKRQIITYGLVAIVVSTYGFIVANSTSKLNSIGVPVVTFIVIGILCLFNIFIVKTKLGQDFRAVGMDQHVAATAGIDVDRTRVIAIIMSIVFAAWGQVIFLQNLGNLNTYGSHAQIGLFAIAAILIGGASVTKATVGQAVVGAFLFHTLFLLAPLAGRNLMGDAQLGEYFRVFVAYGVIALSLVMHAWKRLMLHNASQRALESEED